MGSFFSSLVGTYANVALQRRQVEQSEQDKDRAARVNILTSALASPNFNWQDPTNVNAVLDQLGELTGGGGKGKGGGGGGGGSKDKGGKSSGIDHLRTIFERLRGQVPKQAGLQQPLAVNQKSFLTDQQVATNKANASNAASQAKVQSVLRLIERVDPDYFKRNPSEREQLIASAYGLKAQPTVKWTQVRTEPIEGAAIGRPPGTWWAEMHDEQGNVQYVPSAPPKVTPSMAPKVVSQGGVPYGVSRAGKTVIPGMPGFNAEDAQLLAAANGAYKQSNTDKAAKLQQYYTAYAKMRGQVYQYSAIDLSTGQPVFVNSNTINDNPGRYSAASVTQQLKNRAATFDEIQNSVDLVNQAIDTLPDVSFNAKQRALISLVLKDRDPASAWSQFIGSSVGQELSQEQVAYVTAVKSLDESAMALRSLAGLGAGSDMLRGAIVNMLPGPGTPTKDYARRQMNLFSQEVKKLRSSLPSSDLLGMGAGGTGGAGGNPPPPPSRSTHPNVKIPTGWRWQQTPSGQWGITDGKSFRPWVQ